METKQAFDRVVQETEYALGRKRSKLKAMQRLSLSSDVKKGVYLGKRLRNEGRPAGRNEQDGEQSTRRPCSSDPWELLALVWVQTLLYAAPYGDMQRHMERLSQGGEFITHLWALLYHIGIDSWEMEEPHAHQPAKPTAESSSREATEIQEID